MVVGFLGTLIGLERAVALKNWWAYGIPVCAGLSAITALFALPIQSASLGVVAAILLIAVFVALYCQYPSEHFIIMALSALAWLSGNILWLADAAFFSIVPWWVGFLVLIIAGERLELSRLARANHIAHDNRPGVAVPKHILSARRPAASIPFVAHCRRRCAIALVTALGWLAHRRGDFVVLGQQRARGSIGDAGALHPKTLILRSDDSSKQESQID